MPCRANSPIPSLPAAMLVLFPALARAGIISADFRAGTDGPGFLDRGRSLTDDVAALRRAAFRLGLVVGASGSAEGAGGLVCRPLWRVSEEILEGHQAGG